MPSDEALLEQLLQFKRVADFAYEYSLSIYNNLAEESERPTGRPNGIWQEYDGEGNH
ncbi:MAG: hypothetical protein QXZ36_03695 [Thermoproteota archaeon]